MSPSIPTVLQDATLEQAMAEYLAVSRTARLYADAAAYGRAEAWAWGRLMAAANEARGEAAVPLGRRAAAR